MPVFGVTSKLRPPAVGSKPVHTALPMPSLGTPGSQHSAPKPVRLTGTESSMLACQVQHLPTCGAAAAKALCGEAEETEDSKVSGWWRPAAQEHTALFF